MHFLIVFVGIYRMRLLVFLLALLSTSSAYVFQKVTISLLEPGIRFSYPVEDGTTLVAYHFSINTQLQGVAAGQYNVDVTSPTNGAFVYENKNILVNPGDTVNYWINVINNGLGHTQTDMSWTASVLEPTTTTTTKATTQAPPVTEDNGNQNTNPPQTTEASSGGGNAGGPIVVPSGCSSYPCDSSCDMKVAPCNGLIFEENWDDFDLTRWQHEITMSGGGNWEFQFYTNNRSNSYVRDNTLFIKPTLTADHYGESFLSSGSLDLWGGSPADFCTGNAFWGCQRTGSGTNYLNPIQSARIRSVNSFAFQYGRIEVEAKMPQGDWIWPAIWLLPRDNAYGGWPASGEIDIVEARGNLNLHDESGSSKGIDTAAMTLHWGPYWPLNGYPLTTAERHLTSGTYASGFHKYRVDWTKDYIDFYIDGVRIKRNDPGEGFWSYGDFAKSAPNSDNPWTTSPNKMAPFDKDFYIIMNVAVGGTNGYFQDSWTPQKPWLNQSPTAMKDFWLQKNSWYNSWQPDVENGERAAMQVKSIKVWADGAYV